MSVRSDETSPRLAAEGAAARFLVASGPADAHVSVRLGDTEPECAGERLFEAAPLWQLFRDGERLRFRFRSEAHGPLPYKEARFTADFSRGEVVLRRGLFEAANAVDPLAYPLDELLVQGLLARGRGVELHACGVISAGRGLLFVGQSRGGKTTMARLWQPLPGVAVASDDRIIVRGDGNHFILHGTPWHGEAELAAPASAPLSAVFLLAHGPRHAVTALSPAEAAARLFACSFLPFWDRDGVDFTIGFLGAMTGAVPCHELAFVPEPSVVDFVSRQVGA
jgi:hypothetical protein